jgi:hypothetical protein
MQIEQGAWDVKAGAWWRLLLLVFGSTLAPRLGELLNAAGTMKIAGSIYEGRIFHFLSAPFT